MRPGQLAVMTGASRGSAPLRFPQPTCRDGLGVRGFSGGAGAPSREAPVPGRAGLALSRTDIGQLCMTSSSPNDVIAARPYGEARTTDPASVGLSADPHEEGY